MTRYHPFLVALHWLMALLIIVALVAGNVILEHTPNSDPAKIDSLRAHMSIGLAVLVLTVIRLITRFVTTKPPHVETGNRLMDLAGVAAHWALYALILLVVVSGMATGQMAGLGEIVFFGADKPLPESFDIYAPRAAHGVLTTLLGLLILLHIAAAAFHQIILKDGLMRRMGFGKRDA